ASGGKGTSSGGSDGDGSTSGQGVGHGSGSSSGSGPSRNGEGGGKNGKETQQLADLQNDMAKAQTKLAQDASSANKTVTARDASSNGAGGAPKPSSTPNQSGGQNSSSGSGLVPQPQTLARSKMPSGQSPGARRNDQGSLGDTHLGEFPKPGG